MGYKQVRTLGDVGRYGLRLKVTCPSCGRARELSAGQLYHRFPSNTRLDEVGKHLVCLGTDLERKGCGHRGAIVDFILPEPPNTPDDNGGGGGNVVSIFPRLFGSQPFWDHAGTRKRRRRG